MKNRKQGKTPIIRLDDEGALLQCQLGFVAKVLNNESRKCRYVDVKQDDYVMFLGTRHFRSRKNEMREIAVGPRPWPDDVWRNRLLSELFHGPYYTSLNFLWKEKIVKVDWHGKWGLDQLTEASHFMYLYFRVPDSARR